MFEGIKNKLRAFAEAFAKKEETEEEEKEKEERKQGLEQKEESKEEKAEEGEQEQEEAERKKEGKQAAQKEKEKENKEKEARAKADITFKSKVKGVLLGKVKVTEEDVGPFIDSLKIDLIKSDVAYDVAEKLAEKIKSNMLGKEIDAKNAKEAIQESMRKAMLDMLPSTSIDFVAKVLELRKNGVVKILFLGPNGAGKTTTIAKIAHMLKQHGLNCVIAASDTFRAAAIEQLEHHARALGVELIKGKYGADPASVAFDAIAHANAKGFDCVLIDTAGRQETNKSLLEELRKIARVAKPDFVVFVGEAITGNALLQQIKEFNEVVKIDGIILTKLDCDAKGGGSISVLSEAGIPILFFGIGEKHTDLMPYSKEFVVDSVLGS
ncbi:MAG: signal recognition particle-docking protein FtsY [Candidatus Micrarchaeia archaeon]